MARKIVLIAIVLLNWFQLYAQNYNQLPAKEEYDSYFENVLTSPTYEYNPCFRDPNDDSPEFGDHLSKMLEGLLTMYETTGDKGYLYRFMHLSLCIIENRHDYQPELDSDEPRLINLIINS